MAAIQARDAGRLVTLTAPDITWEPASTETVTRTPYHGHEGLLRYLADLDRDWEEFEVTVGEIREAGPYAIALCRAYARAGGAVADSPVAIVWEVRGGVATWGRTFTDRAEALRFAGLQ